MQEVSLRDISNQIDARFVQLGDGLAGVENGMASMEDRMDAPIASLVHADK